MAAAKFKLSYKEMAPGLQALFFSALFFSQGSSFLESAINISLFSHSFTTKTLKFSHMWTLLKMPAEVHNDILAVLATSHWNPVGYKDQISHFYTDNAFYVKTKSM